MLGAVVFGDTSAVHTRLRPDGNQRMRGRVRFVVCLLNGPGGVVRGVGPCFARGTSADLLLRRNASAHGHYLFNTDEWSG